MSSIFYTSDNVCLQNIVLLGKIISYVIFNKFKHSSYYKLVEAYTSPNAHEIATKIN